jgi:hypothetical protein
MVGPRDVIVVVVGSEIHTFVAPFQLASTPAKEARLVTVLGGVAANVMVAFHGRDRVSNPGWLGQRRDQGLELLLEVRGRRVSLKSGIRE